MKRNVLKKAAVAVGVIASLSFFVACGGDDPVDPGDGDNGGGTNPPVTGTDTVFAMTVVHPDGWSPMIDTPTFASTATVTGEAGTPAVMDLVRSAQSEDQETAGQWPYADMLGAMDAGGSLEKMDSVEITYTINSIEDGANGVSFAITSGYETGIPSAGYARFHVILTGGNENGVTVGEEVTDVFHTGDFFISYGSDQIAEGETLDGEAGMAFLKTANSLTFAIEDEGYRTTSALNVTVSDIQIFGATGLKEDMKIQ